MTTLTPEQQEKNRKLREWLFQDRDYTRDFYDDWNAIHACLKKLTDEQLSEVIIRLTINIGADSNSDIFRATKEQWVDALCEGLGL